jgi:ATP/maltotriose-dependent transcriptional regulator MalT/DNA-binding SARP family transcriptional activator
VSRQQSPHGRRAPWPPSPLGDELIRVQLLDAFAARFDVPVTTVIAGAGFGKTTTLAQAIRANDAEPRGIDAWIACEPGDEDDARLSAAILSALGASVPVGSHLDRILSALRTAAPVDVCIAIDDLHELPAASAGATLVRELTAQLPPHAHLVLASREPLPIPLARRRAAGQVLEIGAEALAFSDAEVKALTELLGEDLTACEGLAGWPSLVRLVLSAPPGATRQFLWEEIVAGLSPAERSGLLALAMLGSGSAAEVATVSGCDVDVEALVGRVPLLHQDAHNTFGAHQLWEDAAERTFPPAEVVEVRQRALRLLADRDETIRMGSAAVRWGDPDMFRVASVSLVRESLGVLPTDTAVRWLEGTPARAVDTPEQRLLDLALRHARHRHHVDMDSELDALETSFVERGDRAAQAVTLALGAVSAHARGDVLRLVTLTERIKLLPGVEPEPLLQFFVEAVDAAHRSLAGDVDGSLRTLEAMSFDQVPPLLRELMIRLHATMLLLAGRAGEAVSVGRSLAESPHAFVRTVPAMLRWAAGDPSGYVAAPPSMEELPDDHLYRFIRTTHCAVVAASLGDRALAAAVGPELEAAMSKPLNVRDSAIAAAGLACCRILDHQEEQAEAAIADHLARHPLTDPRSEAHLRRNIAIVYLADDRVRECWDAAELGPMHRRARELARSLLAARDGHLDPSAELGPVASVVTSLPLPWSVELAVRALAVDCPDGDSLLRALAAWLPAATSREVGWLAEHGDETCRAPAARLLDDLRERVEETLGIDVLGPLRLRAGDAEISSPELRRSRVRTLLALLVLRGPMRRERICDLLWPDLEPTAATQNLRVTLSRLRRLLEPARPPGDSTSRIRSDSSSIELIGPPLVDTDLWQFQGYLAEADHAQQVGDAGEEVESLARAVDLWRGEPLVDLAPFDELRGEVEYVRRSLVDGCLRLGELLLVAGRFDESLRCAERSRSASPYSERAHRLAIACHLQRHDHAGLDAAVRSTEAMLADLGVQPDDSTKMVLRRAVVRLGPRS